MTDENKNENDALEQLKARINKNVSELFDFNQALTKLLRDRAIQWEEIATFFEAGRDRSYQIMADIAGLASEVSDRTSDIIIAEMGITLVSEEDEDGD